MAIAFYCEDEGPKVLQNGSGSQAYYEAAYGYHHHHQQHQQQPQHGVAVGPQQHAGTSGPSAVDGHNNNNNNCALHGSGTGAGGGAENGANSGEVQHDAATMQHSSNRQLMRVLHQVLYRYTMEGVLGPNQTSCIFCNRIYYLFQLLY